MCLSVFWIKCKNYIKPIKTCTIQNTKQETLSYKLVATSLLSQKMMGKNLRKLKKSFTRKRPARRPQGMKKKTNQTNRYTPEETPDSENPIYHWTPQSK